jgi:FkbM family methyltransferase
MIRKILPDGLKALLRRKILGVDVTTYFFSQGGEDAILIALFEYVLKIKEGFFVDVGAYHPTKGSNTFLLYRKGWKGINIEPNVAVTAEFNRIRKRDINLQIGISRSATKQLYYVVDGNSTMNSFSLENIERLGLKEAIKERIEIETYPLGFILHKYVQDGEIDFLNIDTEGYEMEVLESNDWGKYVPKVIAIEQNNIFSLTDVLESTVNNYLVQLGYVAFAKNLIIKDVSTVFYIQRKLID